MKTETLRTSPQEVTYPFRMYGRIVQAYRFEVRYEDGRADYYPSKEEAEISAARDDGTVNPFANSALWMDGIEVADVPDTYSEAVKVYVMGEAAYQRKKTFDAAKDAEKLRADLDYVMLMGGLS